MTCKELIKELKQYPANAEVFYVGDWMKIDEDNQLCDLHKVKSTCEQVRIVDMGLDFEEEHEILLDVEQ